MSLDPLKKELESIDEELESAMLHLSETTQRVDELLADFAADAQAPRRAPSGPIEIFDPPASSDSAADDENE